MGKSYDSITHCLTKAGECKFVRRGNSDDLAKARKWTSNESESVENVNKKVPREIFKAIMIAQFITPSESCLREKSFSRKAEQVRTSSLVLLLLDAGAYLI